MLQLLYIIAFTILAFLAISNLIRNLISFSMDSQKHYPPANQSPLPTSKFPSHPELLDAYGNPINEPLLVMRSMTVEDARQQLDALYKASPSDRPETAEE
jgi:hypothetical protein